MAKPNDAELLLRSRAERYLAGAVSSRPPLEDDLPPGVESEALGRRAELVLGATLETYRELALISAKEADDWLEVRNEIAARAGTPPPGSSERARRLLESLLSPVEHVGEGHVDWDALRRGAHGRFTDTLG